MPEALEDMRQLVCGDSGAVVPHREADLAIALLGPDDDRASFRGELDRVPDQIREDLKDPRPIAPEIVLPARGVNLESKRLLLGEVTAANLKKSARRFLDANNYVFGVMRPKE